MACKLTNLSDFTLDKKLSCPEAGRRRFGVWQGLTKFGWCKNHFQINLSQGTGEGFFRKINKKLPSASVPGLYYFAKRNETKRNETRWDRTKLKE